MSMVQRKASAKPALKQTPLLEWAAAALGLVATLSVLGYSIWEGLAGHDAPPNLSVVARAAEATSAGFATPITVRNESPATAADVEVRASLEVDGRVVEERRATFSYVPGQGEVRGGVIFSTDPRAGRLRLEAEGWQDP